MTTPTLDYARQRTLPWYGKLRVPILMNAIVVGYLFTVCSRIQLDRQYGFYSGLDGFERSAVLLFAAMSIAAFVSLIIPLFVNERRRKWFLLLLLPLHAFFAVCWIDMNGGTI